ncbi:formimidoylglutamate deiminase [Pseudorhodoplanes sinuspersici]|uniref:formimidoylglutamate deiminase n=1 Tax=Pseudorhodoplanes sinuspersici TaxID=1235591 RepID=UPI000A320148|nr:formimidoylglutamate deiminase [Pseudorhodoplanes sinuspersici]
MTVRSCILDKALLPDGWADNVRIDIAADGTIARVQPGAAPDGAERIKGVALPGLPNLHCHAFQKGMAGLAERRGPAHDSFWTWREVMYRFLGALTPDDVEAIAAYAYMDMLEAGFTSVGEFHYLHHDIGGQPYADLGEMAARIAAASSETGIGLTLLSSLYTYGGFGDAAPNPGQARFINPTDRFLKLLARSREIVAVVPHAAVGIAPHSLRAVSPQQLKDMMQAVTDGPIHIHAAEQTREVDDCVAALGARPVEWLLDNANVDQRWCLIHATHMTDDETRRLAHSGAVAGLCPLTEGSLGDGIFNGEMFLHAQGRFGVGTDSNIQIDAPAELRQLEYSQRLKHRGRNIMTQLEGQSTGRCLYTTALAGGAQALGRKIGALAPGRRADIVILNADHPDLAGARDDMVLDVYVFSAGRSLVNKVMAGGVDVVSDGRHRAREAIARRYRQVVSRLSNA